MRGAGGAERHLFEREIVGSFTTRMHGMTVVSARSEQNHHPPHISMAGMKPAMSIANSGASAELIRTRQ
jgi:hypothetical protein